MSLTLEVADRMADACLAHGRASGFEPLTVAVLDLGGHCIVMKRSDDSGYLRNDIAFGKAWGSLGMRRSSRQLAKPAQSLPHLFMALSAVSNGRLVPVPGGVLISDGPGNILGAVGVSGDTSDRDEACAIAAIEYVGLVARLGEHQQ